MYKNFVLIIAVIVLLSLTAVSKADVRTRWDDIEIVVSGETEFYGVAVDPFFTSLDAEDEWNYYIGGMIKLAFDVRFSEYSGLYFSIKNAKTTTGKTFGDGIVRSKGSIFGFSAINMILDEAFFELDRILISELSVRAGLMHVSIGLDTSEEDWFDGHGQLFLNPLERFIYMSYYSFGFILVRLKIIQTIQPVRFLKHFNPFGKTSMAVLPISKEKKKSNSWLCYCSL